MEEDRERSGISKSRSIAEMGEFWDSHDATDWDDQTEEVDIVLLKPVSPVQLRELALRLRSI